jgi:DNA-binding MarR family transcriptional regulator
MAKKTSTAKAATATVEKKPTDGLRKPQIRILQALGKAKEPLTRAEISKRAKVDSAWLTEYVGSVVDAKIRAKNDKKFKSLVTLGHVTAKDSDDGTVYSITSSGRKAVGK